MEKSKIKIDIKNVFEEMLFSFEKEYNTLIDTLLEAIRSNADLRYANLRYADLSNANLRYADLSNADLSNADLSNANLSNADLSNANLSNADLSNADLSNADLSNANLSNADLSNANLFCSILDEKEKDRFGKILKEKMIAYKKCDDKTIVKLEIPKGAIVFSINNKKYRTNVAKILEIEDSEGSKIKETVSKYDQNFKYKTGKTIEIKDFNLMYNVECGPGIHFFKTKKEAQEYSN